MNARAVLVVRDGAWVEVECQSIVPGDIVMVKKNDEFPCDMVLLFSSETIGRCCLVQTSNIDGETDLKSKRACAITSQLSFTELLHLKVFDSHFLT